MAGTLPRDHRAHVFCGRKCVPEFLHSEFLAAFGGDPAVAAEALQRWYAQVDDSLPDGPIGDEPVKFWRAQYAAKFPSAAPKPPGKPEAATSAVPNADETRRRYLQGPPPARTA